MSGDYDNQPRRGQNPEGGGGIGRTLIGWVIFIAIILALNYFVLGPIFNIQLIPV